MSLTHFTPLKISIRTADEKFSGVKWYWYLAIKNKMSHFNSSMV